MKYMNAIISILSGLAVCIPLVVKLVNTVTANVKEKNWSAIVAMVFDYMKQAETMSASGAGKKQWVMSMIEQSAKTLNYPLDDESREKISALIDSACDMAKVVNVEATAK
jgi:uncharacterized membrane protein